MNTANKTNVIKALINDGGSATFAQVVAIVEQKMLKTGNPLRNAAITKEVSYNILLNANYTNMVNNRRENEGQERDFQAKENWFTTSYDGFNGSIVEHRSDPTKQYLKFACNTSETFRYFVDGIEATPAEMEIIKAFKQKSSTPKNQGVENPVIIRTVKIDGIQEIRTNGTKVSF